VFTYHPQIIPLLQWFEMGTTSDAIAGAFSYPDTTTLSSLCFALSAVTFRVCFLNNGAGFFRRRSLGPEMRSSFARPEMNK